MLLPSQMLFLQMLLQMLRLALVVNIVLYSKYEKFKKAHFKVSFFELSVKLLPS